VVQRALVSLHRDRIRDLIARLEFVRDETQRSALIREFRSERDHALRCEPAIERQRD
jgi:hypothetical protein